MLIENVKTFNLEGALRGMRFPMQSNSKSDSYYKDIFFGSSSWSEYVIGPNDLALAQKLIKAGESHSKFLRQIFVSAEITAGLYWWKEFDQYKIGTTTNSESTMHRLAKNPITIENFSFSDFPLYNKRIEETVNYLEELRLEYLRTKDKRVWELLIQLLPSAWNQKRLWTGSYANLLNIEVARRNHKLKEWQYFRETMIKECPYLGLFIAAKERKNEK